MKFERHFSKVVCEDGLLEEFVLRSLVASPLMKPRFTPGGWQEVTMRVLEGFCRLVTGPDVKDRASLKSICFVYYCVKERKFAL